MEIQVVSTFWLLLMVLLWTFVYKYFFWALVFHSCECVFMGGIAGSDSSSMLDFLGATKLFSTSAAPFRNLITSAHGLYFSTSLTIFFSLFKIIAILVHGGGISLWFWFAFPRWMVLLSIFSCVHWPFVCLLWGVAYSGPLSSF